MSAINPTPEPSNYAADFERAVAGDIEKESKVAKRAKEASNEAAEALTYIQGVLEDKKRPLNPDEKKEFISQAARLMPYNRAFLRGDMIKRLKMGAKVFDEMVDAERPEQPSRKSPAVDFDEKVTEIFSRKEVDEVVEEFNQKFFVVENFGDHCVVCWLEDVPDPKKGKYVREEANKKICYQSFANFAHRFEHQRVVTGTKTDADGNKTKKTDTKANVWIHHPNRRQYERVVFKPGEEVSPTEFNLWRGFAYEPVKGDCSLYLAHNRPANTSRTMQITERH